MYYFNKLTNGSPYRIQCNSSSNKSPYRIHCNSSSNRSPYMGLFNILFLHSSGVPAVFDFAAMREAVKDLGGDPVKVNPLCPADLVIDHSVQVDVHVARRYHPSRHCVWSVC